MRGPPPGVPDDLRESPKAPLLNGRLSRTSDECGSERYVTAGTPSAAFSNDGLDLSKILLSSSGYGDGGCISA